MLEAVIFAELEYGGGCFERQRTEGDAPGAIDQSSDIS